MPAKPSTYRDLLASLDGSVAADVEAVIFDVTEMFAEEMDRQGMKQAELARLLGKSRAHVSQVFKGQNFTMKTLVGIAHALGCDVSISLTAKGGQRDAG